MSKRKTRKQKTAMKKRQKRNQIKWRERRRALLFQQFSLIDEEPLPRQDFGEDVTELIIAEMQRAETERRGILFQKFD